MSVSVEIPFELEMCVKGVCTPLKIPINNDFQITSLEIDSSNSPLSHACKIRISFGNEIVYNGMLGSQGFVLTVVDIDEGADFDITLHTDCSLLLDLTEGLEPINVIVKGNLIEKQRFNSDWMDEWV